MEIKCRSNLRDQYRRAAGYADMILKGANPGELPIQLTTKFEFTISLKAAKGIDIEKTLHAE
jgi:putative ABC transport system substrate-binding protein